MYRLIKKNPALATGILLPVLLVVLFSIAALVPKFLVEPPGHDLLFSVKSYSLQAGNEYKFTVEDETLKLQARKFPTSNGSGGYNYKLYWYQADKQTVQEIALPDKDIASRSWVSLPPLEQLKNWKITAEL